jgi:acetoacetyl-CoA synthetase
MDDYAVYNGKTVDLRPKMVDLVSGIKENKTFQSLVSMPRFKQGSDISLVPCALHLHDFILKAISSKLEFEMVEFRDPFMIAYSSGTTGIPKCIVHSTGGALINSAKENILHSEISSKSVVLQYTTTGWIMYYTQVTNLFSGARVVLYDGSPLQPDITTFVKIIGEQKVTKLGTSPRWMSELQMNNIVPKDVCDLSALKAVSSTGMVLSEQQFEWFYDVAFPPSVHLANISGGTDIAGCFGTENPLTPVYVGGTQGPVLGTPVAVYDSLIEGGPGIQGEAVPGGTPGELVAHGPFPNMPPFFWNDVPPPSKDSKYFNSYFAKYKEVWTHGDFVMLHPVTGQLTFLGRADGVLNPSGVRFGSAEIYSVIEGQFGDRVSDSICVGQRRPTDMDETVILFLLMRQGEKFTQGLVNDIKTAIRKELSARHVPKYVFETPDIPVSVQIQVVYWILQGYKLTNIRQL